MFLRSVGSCQGLAAMVKLWTVTCASNAAQKLRITEVPGPSGSIPSTGLRRSSEYLRTK